MKSILLMVLAVLASSAVMAEDKAVDPAAFQAMKDKHLGLLQERLQMVQTNISCIQAATDVPAMKVCKDTAKKTHDALEVKMKAAVAEIKAKHAK
jgi:hypothetical protein